MTKMFIDPKKIERISPDYWRNSLLSISRFSNGCIINGTRYFIDPDTDFLVRSDIWRAEIKDKEKQKRIAIAEKKKWASLAQGNLFGNGNAKHHRTPPRNDL